MYSLGQEQPSSRTLHTVTAWAPKDLGLRSIGLDACHLACRCQSQRKSVPSLLSKTTALLDSHPSESTLGSIAGQSVPSFLRTTPPAKAVNGAQSFRHLFSSGSFIMEQHHGAVRSKRKGSPVSLLDRPAKLLKAQTPGLIQNGEMPHAQHSETDTDGEDGLIPVLTTATADSAEWQETIERVVRNVVSIHFCQTCSFDTDPAVSSEATGFVVDAARGYIMTNRHVVGAGPFWGYCIFDNHEEVCHG